MSWEMVQHAVVTLTAMGAAGVLLREVGAFLWPRKGAPACGNCSTGKQRSAKRAPGRSEAPVILQIQGRRRA
jgi:hypothetical protein